MKLKLFEYVLDSRGRFWIVCQIKSGKPYGFVVYCPNPNGARYNNITKCYYDKCAFKTWLPIPAKIKQVFCPRAFYQANKHNLTERWKRVAFALNLSGIADCNIGIFGSYLIGFDVIKDVDFVVYGKQNLFLVYNNIELVRESAGATAISEHHADYQTQKFNSEYPLFDMQTIIRRNWSGLQFERGLLSTVRFVCKNLSSLPSGRGRRKTLVGRVKNGITSSCLPRQITLVTEHGEYKVYSWLWKLQSFARDGETIKVHGMVNQKAKTIVLCGKLDFVSFVQ